MSTLNEETVAQALNDVGEALGQDGATGTIEIVIAGGSAALLGGLLRAGRVTADCDVFWKGDEQAWERVRRAAAEVGQRLGLAPNWLNRECSVFAWCLAFGWQERVVAVGVFGPLKVGRLSRLDLMAMKIVGAPRRPQDYMDVADMRPTAADLDWLDAHLDRLAAEHLGSEEFEQQRVLVASLRSVK